MQYLDLILTLAAGLSAALGLGYVAHRLGWSPIVGYLLAGVLVGPHTPGFVADRHLAEQLAEVGVILLMFGVGLHFHLKDLLAVRTIAIVGAIVQSAAATVLGAVTAHAFGWGWSAGIVFGLALSVASTVVLIRVLSDHGALHGPTGRVAVGWLVMEDIFTVLMLVLLPILLGPAVGPAGVAWAGLLALLKLAGFGALVLLAGPRIVPWLLNRVAATHSRELFTLSVLALALGIAAGSAYFFQISMALGAFLAGMVVGQSEFSARAAAEALPMRDAFAVMFFLSVGMLFDPLQTLGAPLLVVATLAVVMIGKPLAALLIAVALGYGSRVGLGVAAALAQIGEFSFLLASLGLQLGVLPAAAMNAVVAGAIVSITLNPILYASVPRLNGFIERRPRLYRLLNFGLRRAAAEDSAAGAPTSLAHRAIVVGYGPIGQTLVRLLASRGIEPTVIEMNIDTVRRLHAAGIRAVFGDANQNEVLERAGVGQAMSLILSSSGSAAAVEAIRNARHHAPRIFVIARADFLAEAQLMRKAGADEVFSGEGEVALAITGSILEHIGSTPGQLDETREWIRTHLLDRGVPGA